MTSNEGCAYILKEKGEKEPKSGTSVQGRATAVQVCARTSGSVVQTKYGASI